MAVNQTTMDDLPTDIVVEILSKAGEYSSDSLFTAKSACKRFLYASDDNLVYKRLSLARFPIIQWYETQRQTDCMNRCFQAGNPQSICRAGLMEYFHRNNPGLGLLLLKDAAESGNREAVYMYGMIHLASGVEASQSDGIHLLNDTFSKTLSVVDEVRETVVGMVRRMWLRNNKPFEIVQTKCQARGHVGYVVNIFRDHYKPDCMACFWFHELEMVARRLR